MPRILYISYDGMTDPLGQSQVLPYLIGLRQKGYQITILSTEKRENFIKRQALISQITQSHHIDWEYVFYTKKPPVLSTLKDITQLQQKANQLQHKKKFDIIHCRSYIAALIGKKMKRKFGIKFIFDMRGFWADERVDGGLWNLKNPIFRLVYQFFKKQEKKFLQEADYTISLTHHAKDEIKTWNLPKLAPIQVIPCCVDLDLFEPKNYPNKDAKPYALSYLGSIGTWYMLPEMLAFFRKLLDQKPEARLLFITTDQPEIIKAEAQKQGVPSSQIDIQPAERAEVPSMLLQAEMSIFFIKPLFSKKASSATKMGEILAMGIPVITNDGVGDHPYLFENYELGLLLPDFTEDTFTQAIQKLEEVSQIPPEKLQKAATSYFSLSQGIEQYAKVYTQVLK